MSILKTFKDLLKRGNLPDDTRDVPNWLKIKNRQFENVDFASNTVDSLIALSSPEFNEFVSNTDSHMLLVYLSTLSDTQMQKFYRYLDEVVKLDEGIEHQSARVQFENALFSIKKSEITNEQRVRATLEIPLMINFAKHIYHAIMDFIEYASQDYYNYDIENEFKMYEGHLEQIIWGKMNLIPDSFEQVIDHFKNFYDENNEEHKKFFIHLSKRFGLLIATLSRLIYKTQDRATSLNWFVSKMVDYDVVGSVEISISQSKSLTTDQKLINFLTTTFGGICDESDDNYLSSLICVVETLFEWYPVNREACDYAMVEMMKSVGVKKVNVDNANAFIAFFEKLPRFYEVLSYDKIYQLKELINHTLTHYEVHKNEVFEQESVKNKLVLLNYFIDMEDLYYESGKNTGVL
ncbi:MAG: hypothetical protein J0647_11670 [Campylobacteraceae bacterium]|nr:hypothetical protein [Campylobacteraceae bacterium]